MILNFAEINEYLNHYLIFSKYGVNAFSAWLVDCNGSYTYKLILDGNSNVRSDLGNLTCLRHLFRSGAAKNLIF